MQLNLTRISLRLLLFVAIGFATTIFVTAACTKRGERIQVSPNHVAQIDGPWIHFRYHLFGFDRYVSDTTSLRSGNISDEWGMRRWNFDERWNPQPGWRPLEQNPGPIIVAHHAVGFPFRCLVSGDGIASKWNFIPDQSSPLYVSLYDARLFISYSQPPIPRFVFIVPVRPLPIGLALNTMFYASAWWLFLFAPFKLRRALRRRAGKCVKCKYDLSGIEADQPCPECGRVKPKEACTLKP